MNKISLREKLGYGVGAIGLDLSYGMFYSYLFIKFVPYRHKGKNAFEFEQAEKVTK